MLIFKIQILKNEKNVEIRKITTLVKQEKIVVNVVSINLKFNSVHLSHWTQIPNAIRKAYQGILRLSSDAAVKGERAESEQTVDIGRSGVAMCLLNRKGNSKQAVLGAVLL